MTAYRPTNTGLLAPDHTATDPMSNTPDTAINQHEHDPNPAEQPAASDTETGAATGWWTRWTADRDAGETLRVRRARRGQARDTNLAETDPRSVRRKTRKQSTSAQLEDLAGDPRAEAHANRRWRLVVLLMSFAGIALGVGISSTTAQTTITTFMGWTAGTVEATLAYGADPALGLVLFSGLAARALAAARGVSLPVSAQTALNRIELVLFALIAILNIGPSTAELLAAAASVDVAGVGSAAMVLVIHSLGPVLVAAGVFGTPYVLAVLGAISEATTAKVHAAAQRIDGGVVVPLNQAQQPDPNPVPQRWMDDYRRVLAAIDTGELPVDPSGNRIHTLLGGDAAKKGPLRDAVAGYRPHRDTEGVAA